MIPSDIHEIVLALLKFRIMKNYLLFCFICFHLSKALAQASATFTVFPSSPAPSDSLRVVTNVTYSGNCSYGMVHSSYAVSGSTINIYVLYCGHGSTTTCNEQDTIFIAPQPAGKYTVNIDYHQGSVCPISGFDAVIANRSGTVTVATKTTVSLAEKNLLVVNVYPNPAADRIVTEVAADLPQLSLCLLDQLGREVCVTEPGVMELSLNGSGVPGMYLLLVRNNNEVMHRQKIIVSAK
jgi:hypothetical protein